MHHPSKQLPIRAIRVSLEDIRRIFERLQAQVDAEGERVLSGLTRPDSTSEEQHAANRADLKSRAFRITVTVGGRDGSSLFGDDVGTFSSPNLPDQISFIYMTNVVAFEGVANQKPPNRFSLTFDFSKPPLLDAQNFVSSPTPNQSQLHIEGDNDAWVSTIFDAVDGIVKNRHTGRKLIHRGFSYDIGMFIFALPLSFWVCFRASSYINSLFGGIHDIVSGSAYVYLFFVALFFYRILFGYTKWAFPTAELTSNVDHSGRHRIFWSAIVLGIAGNAAWDLVKHFA
jgi:hypothetical protein